MVHPHKIFGRLGNSLFQYATLIALAAETQSDVYFQNTKWFEKYEKDIRIMFGPGIGFRPEVSIHVRRGDYLDIEHRYPNLSKTNYYEEAVVLFPADTKFLVFSDDITWCKEKWGNDSRFAFSEGNDEIGDLNAMASCSSHIIANSSFSWWGAWLGKNPSKKVICPRQELWGSNISLPETWTQL